MSDILIINNNDMGLYKFRFELLEELRRLNYSVCIMIPDGPYVTLFENVGCRVIKTKIERRGTNPFKDYGLYRFIKKVIKAEKPRIILSYTIKPNIYGSIAARKYGIPILPNITGLGTAVENKSIKRKIIFMLYRYAFKKNKTVFFQNKVNIEVLKENKVHFEEDILLPGSGVNLDYFTAKDYPKDDVIVFLYVGRIMKDKGISELIDAAKRVKNKHNNVVFQMIGYCEEDYEKHVKDLSESNVIQYLGVQSDVRPFIEKCSALINPSYHEGLSNVLLEASAMGRPVIASRIPGCQETFIENETGLGFKPRDFSDLEESVERFMSLSYEQRAMMGKKAREYVEKKFSRKNVVNRYIVEIRKIIGEKNESL